MTTATLATDNATTQQLPRQAQQPGRDNRITERDPDYLRLRAETERQLTDSLARLVREVRRARHDTQRVAEAQTAFIRRHTALLSQAYRKAHGEGARDYFGAVSHQPSKWARRVLPSGARMEQRLLFYAAGSVTRMANEAALAAHQMHVAKQAAGTSLPTQLRETVRIASERVTGAFSWVRLADGGAPEQIPADALDAWFVGMRGRLQLQSEITWNGLQDGYSDAGAVDPASPYTVLYWELGPVKTQHCEQCPVYAAGSPYGRPGSGDNELNATPGDGHTDCGAACHCSLRYGSDPDAVRRAVYAWLDAGVAAGWIDPEAWANEQEVVPTEAGAAVGVEPGPAYEDLPTDEVHLRSLMIDALDQYRAAVEAYQATLVAQGQQAGGLPDLLSSNADALAQMLEALPTLTVEQQRLVVAALDATAGFALALEQAASLGFDALLWDVGYIRLAETARGWGFIDYQHDPKTGQFAPTGAGGGEAQAQPRTIGPSAARGEHGTKGRPRGRGAQPSRRTEGPSAHTRAAARSRERKAAEYQVSAHHAAMRKLAARMKGAQPAERLELQRQYRAYEAQVAPHVERLLQMGVSEADINQLSERWRGWRFFNPNHDPHSGRFAPGGMGGAAEGEGVGGHSNTASGAHERMRAQAPQARPSVVYGDRRGQSPEHVREQIRDLFGRELSDEEVASLVGAQAHDLVHVDASHGGLDMELTGRDSAGHTLYRAQREVTTNRRGDSIIIENQTFHVLRTGAGLGTRVFADQAHAASRLGVDEITTTAARGEHNEYNGYYTWPRLGYDTRFFYTIEHYPEGAPDVVQEASRLSEIMATPEGRAWWRQYGHDIELTFDTTSGSRSLRTLDAYLQERGMA